MKQIGPKIRQAREACGMTQAEVARHLGISRQWMCEMEQQGSDPCASRLLRLAEILHVDVRYLLGLIDEREEIA